MTWHSKGNYFWWYWEQSNFAIQCNVGAGSNLNAQVCYTILSKYFKSCSDCGVGGIFTEPGFSPLTLIWLDLHWFDIYDDSISCQSTWLQMSVLYCCSRMKIHCLLCRITTILDLNKVNRMLLLLRFWLERKYYFRCLKDTWKLYLNFGSTFKF